MAARAPRHRSLAALATASGCLRPKLIPRLFRHGLPVRGGQPLRHECAPHSRHLRSAITTLSVGKLASRVVHGPNACRHGQHIITALPGAASSPH